MKKAKNNKVVAGSVLAPVASNLSNRATIWGDALPMTAARAAWIAGRNGYKDPVKVAARRGQRALDIELILSGAYLAAGDMVKTSASWRNDDALVELWLGMIGDRHADASISKWLWSLGVKKSHGEQSDYVGAFEPIKIEVESVFRNAFLQSFSALRPYLPFIALRLRMGAAMDFDALPADLAGAGEILTAARKLGGKLATAARSAWLAGSAGYQALVKVAARSARRGFDIELILSGAYLAAGDMVKNGALAMARGASWRDDAALVGLWLGMIGDRHAAAWLRKWLFSLGVKKTHGEQSEFADQFGGVAFDTIKAEVESIFRNAFLQSFSALRPYLPFIALRLRMGAAMDFDALPADLAGAGEILTAARKLGGQLSTACRDASKADLFRLTSGVDLSGVEARAENRLVPLTEKNKKDRERASALREKCSALIAAAAAHSASVAGWSASRRIDQYSTDKCFIFSAWRWAIGRPDGNHLFDLSADSVRHFAARLRARIACGIAAMPPGSTRNLAAAAAADWFGRSGAVSSSAKFSHFLDPSPALENTIDKNIPPYMAAALTGAPAIHRLRAVLVVPPAREPRTFPARFPVSPGFSHGFARIDGPIVAKV